MSIILKKKDALIINHQNFSNIGGIERWLYYLTIYCLNNGIRVIWLCDDKPLCHPVFRELFLGQKIERVYVKRQKLYWFVSQKLDLKLDERYVLFCANPVSMCVSQEILLKYSEFDIFPVYTVPDTTGNMYFLERNFRRKWIRDKVWVMMRKMIFRWDSLNAVRFFTLNQVKALEENYNLLITFPEDKRLRSNRERGTWNDESIRSKSLNRSPFKITTVGRFDFPHKGYMLGLVRAFGKLIQDYPQLELHIAGYGPHENILKNEIASIPENARNSIILHGPIHPDHLEDYLRTAHLNVSVAGGATAGAKVGTLTLVARNYCAGECEVYGFYHDCREKTTSLEKGLPIIPYIRQVLEMKPEEYIEMCKKDFETVLERSKVFYDPHYIFSSTRLKRFSPSKKEVLKMKFLKRIIVLNRYLRIL